MTDKNKKQEAGLFLDFLKEEGIEEIWLNPSQKKNPVTKVQPVPELTRSGSSKEELLQLRDNALKCTLCSELASTRKNVVFGAGNIKAQLMFIGEAPGHDEDEQGLPFVGRAGQLLTKIIESIGLKREDVFIANTLKCRPPGNRPPQPGEISNCNPFLLRQIELISPKIICALGTFAAQTLLNSDNTISALRGRFYNYSPLASVKIICTYHPAYLLRSPGEKRKVWEDMKMIKRELVPPDI